MQSLHGHLTGFSDKFSTLKIKWITWHNPGNFLRVQSTKHRSRVYYTGVPASNTWCNNTPSLFRISDMFDRFRNSQFSIHTDATGTFHSGIHIKFITPRCGESLSNNRVRRQGWPELHSLPFHFSTETLKWLPNMVALWVVTCDAFGNFDVVRWKQGSTILRFVIGGFERFFDGLHGWNVMWPCLEVWRYYGKVPCYGMVDVRKGTEKI